MKFFEGDTKGAAERDVYKRQVLRPSVTVIFFPLMINFMPVSYTHLYAPQIYGNFHTFPIPMAHPADTRIKPRREPKDSLFILF